jgi:hypothetical protein
MDSRNVSSIESIVTPRGEFDQIGHAQSPHVGLALSCVEKPKHFGFVRYERMLRMAHALDWHVLHMRSRFLGIRFIISIVHMDL